jgi:hypothetical protein
MMTFFNARTITAALALSVYSATLIQAEMLCRVHLTSRQYIGLDMNSGDEKVEFTAIEFKCDNLYRNEDTDTVEHEPWPLYGKKCREGTWNSKMRTCVTCPNSMQHLSLEDRQQHFSVNEQGGEWAEFWGCHQESGGRCICEGSKNVRDPHMADDPKMQERCGTCGGP